MKNSSRQCNAPASSLLSTRNFELCKTSYNEILIHSLFALLFTLSLSTPLFTFRLISSKQSSLSNQTSTNRDARTHYFIKPIHTRGPLKIVLSNISLESILSHLLQTIIDIFFYELSFAIRQRRHTYHLKKKKKKNKNLFVSEALMFEILHAVMHVTKSISVLRKNSLQLFQL